MSKEVKTTESLPDLDAADVEKAKEQGALDAIQEGAKQTFKSTDGELPGDVDETKIVPTYDVFHLQDKLELDPKELKKWLEGKSDLEGFTPSQGQAAGLLEVERSGKNRTDVVDVLCKHLGIKTPYEVTDAGPNYTNDVNRAVLKRG